MASGKVLHLARDSMTVDLTPPQSNGRLDELLAVRRVLLLFVRRTLIDSGDLYTSGDKPAFLKAAFDSEEWHATPLFRRLDMRRRPTVVKAMSDAVRRLIWDYEHDPYSDQEAHLTRGEIGRDWSFLALLTLQADVEWLRALAHGGLAHLNREYALRLIPLRPGRGVPATPTDLGSTSNPLPWHPGPLSAVWVYIAYLAALLSNETIVRRLAIPPQIAILAEGWEDRLLALFQRDLRQSLARGASFLETMGNRLQPGDLVIADGLVAALLRSPLCTWEHLRPLIRISPISRLCRSHNLLQLAGDYGQFRLGLRPTDQPPAQARPELRLLAGTSTLPGVHHRVAQSLADACQEITPEVLWSEAAATMKLLEDQAFEQIISVEDEPPEEVYWTTLLLVRVYGLCLRDRTLADVVRRSRYDFAAALGPGRVIDRLLNRRPSHLKGRGAEIWYSKSNIDAVSRLREVYDGTA